MIAQAICQIPALTETLGNVPSTTQLFILLLLLAGQTDSPGQARDQTQPCTGQSDLGLEWCSQRGVLAFCCMWGSLVPVAKGLRTYLSAWRRISGCRRQQAACRCRAPGSHHSQRASGRAGTGCCGRSAAGRGKVVAAMPVAATPSPGPAQSQLHQHSAAAGQAAHQGLEQQLHARSWRSWGPRKHFQGQFITGFG